jgi:stage V sporulation protein B
MLEKTEKRTREKKETFLQGVLVLMFSQVLIKILGLVQTLYLTNRNGFGDKGNAIYMGSYQIYALLLSISSIGIPNAIAKLVSEKIAVGDNESAHRIFKIALLTFGIIGMIGTLLLFFGAEFISNVWLEIPESKVTLMILAPAVFFVAISSVFRGYFNGRQQMTATANAQTFEQFWKTLFTIIFVEIAVVLTSTNTTYMAAAATFATTSAILFSFIYLYRYYIKERKFISIKNDPTIKKENKSAKSIVKTILWISIPISLTAILSSLNK